jgi:hypothetical protein
VAAVLKTHWHVINGPDINYRLEILFFPPKRVITRGRYVLILQIFFLGPDLF